MSNIMNVVGVFLAAHGSGIGSFLIGAISGHIGILSPLLKPLVNPLIQSGIDALMSNPEYRPLVIAAAKEAQDIANQAAADAQAPVPPKS